MVEPTKTPAAATQQPPAAAPATPASQATPPAAKPPVTPPATPPATPASQTPAAKPTGAPQTPPASTPEDKEKVVPINALHEEREKRQQLQSQLDAMKKVMANNVLFDSQGNPVIQQPQQQPQQVPQYQQELEKLWESDPRKAVQAEIMTAMMWRDQVDAQVEQQSTEVAGRNPDFNNFRPEVMTYLRTLPIDQRNKPGMVEAAYYFVKGQKVDNIVAKTREEWEAEYLRKMQAGEYAQTLPTGATSQPPVPQGAVTLTEDQKKAAAAMRMTEADYAKGMVNK